MQLSPLQSRLAASLMATTLLLVVYLFFFFPQFATATELDGASPNNVDDNGGWVNDRAGDDVEFSEETMSAIDVGGIEYEPEFALFDRSIIGRAPAGVTGVTNNDPQSSNIQPGQTMYYVFEMSSVDDTDTSGSSRLRELRRDFNGSQTVPEDVEDPASGNTEIVRRQEATRTLWISANTCQQPSRISPDQTTMDPPQLSLFVSKSSDNTEPGPGQDDVEFIPFDEGAVMFNTALSEDVYFSVHAPEVSSEFFSTALPYNFEIAASYDESYHTVADSSDSQLIWVDSDATGALLTTRNLTSSPDQVLKTNPYLLFANNKEDLRINGLHSSYCGLNNVAQIRVPQNGLSGQITTGLKQGGQGNLTKQEFYVGGLNASSEYVAILVRNPDTTSSSTTIKKRNGPGGGGVVFSQTELSTKPCESLLPRTLPRTQITDWTDLG